MFNRIAFIIFFFSSPAIANELKVGVFDTQRALMEVDDGKKAMATLESEVNRVKGELHQEEIVIHNLDADLTKRLSILSSEAKTRMQQEIEKKVQKYQLAMTRNQADLQKRQEDLLKPISAKLHRLLAEVANHEHYALVLEKWPQTILFTSEAIDLTDSVIRAYRGSG